MDKIDIVTNYVKLVNYLNKNQLVQANAMTQRMEGQLKDELSGIEDPSTNPLFEVMRYVKQVHQMIIVGNRGKALEISNLIRNSLKDKAETNEAINEIKQTLGE